MADLTTVDAVKAYGEITVSTDDALLQSLVTAYSQAVRSYCNRDFTSQDYSITRSGQGSRRLLLPQYPVTAVSSLTINGHPIAAQSAIGSPGYRFSEAAITLDGYCFERGFDNIQISFTAGYATVPADIAQATIEWVLLRYKLREKLEWSAQTLANQSVSSLVTKSMPDTVKVVLDQRKAIAAL